tara:strand:+ start:101 stop:772 length:672 start_codon:yes stop_codon:yes gene_type:complete
MESVSISEDLLKNLTLFSQQLRGKSSSLTNNVDTSDIPEITDVPETQVNAYLPKQNNFVKTHAVSQDFNLQTVSNIESIQKLGIETERLLSLKKNDDPHGEFKVDVKELTRIEETIAEYMEIVKKLKAKKEDLRQKTFNHMVKHKVDGVEVSKKESFNIVISKQKINPMTKARLPVKIRDFFVKEEKMETSLAERLANRILKWIDDNAEYTVTKSLRHKKNKK